MTGGERGRRWQGGAWDLEAGGAWDLDDEKNPVARKIRI